MEATQRRSTVRLACIQCDTEQCDGITPEQLQQLIDTGQWQNVHQVQSYEQATRPIHPKEVQLVGSCGWSEPSVLDWYTHLGLCPDCQQPGSDQSWKSAATTTCSILRPTFPS
jgi:hypothetical protein